MLLTMTYIGGAGIMAQHRHQRSNGTNGQCELVGVDVCEAMHKGFGTINLRWINEAMAQRPGFDAGPCVLTRQTHGYECGHCGALLTIHSHGHIVERV